MEPPGHRVRTRLAIRRLGLTVIDPNIHHTPPNGPVRTVTPGAFCSTRGATGVSKAGKRYRCTTKTGDDRLRWRPI